MRSQGLLLTWLVEEPIVYSKIKKYISADDFTEEPYGKAAQHLLADLEKGICEPAAIISLFQDEEEQRKVAALFNTKLPPMDNITEKEKALRFSAERISILADDWKLKSIQISDTDKKIRQHETDWHKKITLSLSCLIFFFIGAPLGATIRKGGLGLPVVISVIIFVLYYIIDFPKNLFIPKKMWYNK